MDFNLAGGPVGSEMQLLDFVISLRLLLEYQATSSRVLPTAL